MSKYIYQGLTLDTRTDTITNNGEDYDGPTVTDQIIYISTTDNLVVSENGSVYLNVFGELDLISTTVPDAVEFPEILQGNLGNWKRLFVFNGVMKVDRIYENIPHRNKR